MLARHLKYMQINNVRFLPGTATIICTVVLFSSLARHLQKAADAAFQDRNIAGLEEVQSKASRHPQLMECVKMLETKLGY